ncbi:hypothetical protein [Sphingomonas sp. CARO-RG-8B-R24-01]|uniref:nSTAND1 domain-containing NTPase n=1 Tax=Sphingomonas sp. CARO-RG-8B-R24-01 TaxID=2914831 RepID=UPI001F59F875|nr:hypothetical protein [Sphingomonas sp. CARO-RG-8B-R24-01]
MIAGETATEVELLAVSPSSSGSVPYPGLRAFRRDESPLFFGRDTSIDAMVDRLATTRFLAVLGPSGSGKSSLVRAGLYDALKLGLHPSLGGRWQIAECNPGRRPISNLAAALARSAHGNADHDVDLLAAQLGRGPRGLAEVAGSETLFRKGWNILIVVDQFEELFRFRDYGEREETEAFAALLMETVQLDLPLQVVITMRSEYLGACSLFPRLAEQISAGSFLTPRMTRNECLEAIEGPSAVADCALTEDLIAAVLNDIQCFAPFESSANVDQAEVLAHQADQLPLMQHVLNRMWRSAKDQPGREPLELNLDDYNAAGKLSGAIERHGEDVLKALEQECGPRIDRVVEQVFRALFDGPSLSLAVRRPRKVEKLIAAGGGEGRRADVLAVIEAFRADDCSFLRTSEPELDDQVVVDLSHESLIRRWPKLAEWFAAESETDRLWQRLADAAEDHRSDRPAFATGAALERFRDWWEREQPSRFSAERYGKDYDALSQFLAGSVEEARRVAEQREAETKAAAEEREKKRQGEAERKLQEREAEARREQEERWRKVRRRIGYAAGIAVALFIGAAIVNWQLARRNDELNVTRQQLVLATLSSQRAALMFVTQLCGRVDEKDREQCAASYLRQIEKAAKTTAVTALPTQQATGEGGTAAPSQIIVGSRR